MPVRGGRVWCSKCGEVYRTYLEYQEDNDLVRQGVLYLLHRDGWKYNQKSGEVLCPKCLGRNYEVGHQAYKSPNFHKPYYVNVIRRNSDGLFYDGEGNFGNIMGSVCWNFPEDAQAELEEQGLEGCVVYKVNVHDHYEEDEHGVPVLSR